jgi:hypothetical protein
MFQTEALEMKSVAQTLVEIQHPEFRKGYEQGRKMYFQDRVILTDKQLVESLEAIFEEDELDTAQTREESVYALVGQYVGRMSGCVIPRQPSEEGTPNAQEIFLDNFTHRQIGTTKQALSEVIQQFWKLQDLLAEELDADDFDLMSRRGVDRGL